MYGSFPILSATDVVTKAAVMHLTLRRHDRWGLFGHVARTDVRYAPILFVGNLAEQTSLRSELRFGGVSCSARVTVVAGKRTDMCCDEGSCVRMLLPT
jgi:hypothetical protein